MKGSTLTEGLLIFQISCSKMMANSLMFGKRH